MATLALAWVLRRSEVASAITGASRPEQVHANAAASGVKLSDDLLAAVDQALGDVPITEPTSPLPLRPASSTADQAALAPGRRPHLRRRRRADALSFSPRASRLMTAESVPGRPQGRPRATGMSLRSGWRSRRRGCAGRCATTAGPGLPRPWRAATAPIRRVVESWKVTSSRSQPSASASSARTASAVPTRSSRRAGFTRTSTVTWSPPVRNCVLRSCQARSRSTRSGRCAGSASSSAAKTRDSR